MNSIKQQLANYFEHPQFCFEMFAAQSWFDARVSRLLSSTSQEDYRLDGEVLLPYDLKASGAHAVMLQKIGVLTAEDMEDEFKAGSETGS